MRVAPIGTPSRRSGAGEAFYDGRSVVEHSLISGYFGFDFSSEYRARELIGDPAWHDPQAIGDLEAYRSSADRDGPLRSHTIYQVGTSRAEESAASLRATSAVRHSLLQCLSTGWISVRRAGDYTQDLTPCRLLLQGLASDRGCECSSS